MPSAEQSSAYRHYLMKAEDLFLTRVTLDISIKRTPSSNAATRQVRHQTRAELLNVRCTTSYPLLLLPDRVYGRGCVVIPRHDEHDALPQNQILQQNRLAYRVTIQVVPNLLLTLK